MIDAKIFNVLLAMFDIVRGFINKITCCLLVYE